MIMDPDIGLGIGCPHLVPDYLSRQPSCVGDLRLVDMRDLPEEMVREFVRPAVVMDVTKLDQGEKEKWENWETQGKLVMKGKTWVASPAPKDSLGGGKKWKMTDIINLNDWDNRISSSSRNFFFKHYPTQVISMHWPAHLHLCGLDMGTNLKYMRSLAEIVKGSCDRETSIHTLSLRECNIQDEGIRFLAEAFAECGSGVADNSKTVQLTLLDLSSNSISNRGCTLVCDSLTEIPTLRHLKLQNNEDILVASSQGYTDVSVQKELIKAIASIENLLNTNRACSVVVGSDKMLDEWLNNASFRKIIKDDLANQPPLVIAQELLSFGDDGNYNTQRPIARLKYLMPAQLRRKEFNQKRNEAQTLPYEQLVRLVQQNSQGIQLLLSEIAAGSDSIKKDARLSASVDALVRLYVAKKQEFEIEVEMPLYKICSMRLLETEVNRRWRFKFETAAKSLTERQNEKMVKLLLAIYQVRSHLEVGKYQTELGEVLEEKARRVDENAALDDGSEEFVIVGWKLERRLNSKLKELLAIAEEWDLSKKELKYMGKLGAASEDKLMSKVNTMRTDLQQYDDKVQVLNDEIKALATTFPGVKKMKMSADEWVGCKQGPEQVIQFPSLVANGVAYIKQQLDKSLEDLRYKIGSLGDSWKYKSKREQYEVQNMLNLVQLIQEGEPIKVGNVVLFEGLPVKLVSPYQTTLPNEAVIEMLDAPNETILQKTRLKFMNGHRKTVARSQLTSYGPARKLLVLFAEEPSICAVVLQMITLFKQFHGLTGKKLDPLVDETPRDLMQFALGRPKRCWSRLVILSKTELQAYAHVMTKVDEMHKETTREGKHKRSCDCITHKAAIGDKQSFLKTLIELVESNKTKKKAPTHGNVYPAGNKSGYGRLTTLDADASSPILSDAWFSRAPSGDYHTLSPVIGMKRDSAGVDSK